MTVEVVEITLHGSLILPPPVFDVERNLIHHNWVQNPYAPFWMLTAFINPKEDETILLGALAYSVQELNEMEPGQIEAAPLYRHETKHGLR